MSTKELRELDVWIALNVFGLRRRGDSFVCTPDFKTDDAGYCIQGLSYPIPDYTSNPTDAIEVLEKCLQKLGGHEQAAMSFDDTTTPFVYGIRMAHANWEWIYAETLPLAICLFAKKLFTKENP